MNPCNSCGNTELIIADDWCAGTNGFRVKCATTGHYRFSDWASTKDGAIADWNIRNPVNKAGRPRKINDCRSCGDSPSISVNGVNCSGCYNAHGRGYANLDEWNEANPDTELLQAQLEACHEFFKAIGTLAESTLDLDGIRNWAAKLLAEQTETNA